MLKTPLQKMRRNSGIATFFICLITVAYALILLIIFPGFEFMMFEQVLNFLFLVAITLTYILAKKSDPGYIKKSDHVDFVRLLQRFDTNDLCPSCEVIVAPSSRHCTICDRCIDGFDHHCPWINNCVGSGNHNVFITFLLSVLAGIIFAFYSIVESMKRINEDIMKEGIVFSIFGYAFSPYGLYYSSVAVVLFICCTFILPVLALVCV